MTLDARARATAKRLLEKFGKACTLQSMTPGTYSPSTSSVAAAPTPYAIKAYMDQPNKTELASGQVVATDEMAIFAALGLAVEPKVNDTLTVDGKSRTVKMVNRVWSGEQVALWRVGIAS